MMCLFVVVFGCYGIMVNYVLLGLVMQMVMVEEQKKNWLIFEEIIVKMLFVCCIGVFEDIVSVCVWLCQEDVGYVIGQMIGVNGGRIML